MGGRPAVSPAKNEMREPYCLGFALNTYTHATNKMQEEAAQKMGDLLAQAI